MGKGTFGAPLSTSGSSSTVGTSSAKQDSAMNIWNQMEEHTAVEEGAAGEAMALWEGVQMLTEAGGGDSTLEDLEEAQEIGEQLGRHRMQKEHEGEETGEDPDFIAYMDDYDWEDTLQLY